MSVTPPDEVIPQGNTKRLSSYFEGNLKDIVRTAIRTERPETWFQFGERSITKEDFLKMLQDGSVTDETMKKMKKEAKILMLTAIDYPQTEAELKNVLKGEHGVLMKQASAAANKSQRGLYCSSVSRYDSILLTLRTICAVCFVVFLFLFAKQTALIRFIRDRKYHS